MTKLTLSDREAHERLCAASEALGDATGVTIHGNTALIAARKALILLQLGLVKAMDESERPTESEPSLPPSPS